MKNIKIRRQVKTELEEFADGKSINKAMRELLENAETHTQTEYEMSFININFDDDLLDKLKQCKLSPSESHSDTISRLIREHQK